MNLCGVLNKHADTPSLHTLYPVWGFGSRRVNIPVGKKASLNRG